ncbi:hypothetical protein V1L52_08060 [Treponema sp. HNW]|uniref:hypothetical protein n=1 Tax=Treponema sp. HNW TaxID=3116654 RepID=UPI003D0CD857
MKPLPKLHTFSFMHGRSFFARISVLFFVCTAFGIFIPCLTGCSREKKNSVRLEKRDCDPVADFIASMTLEEKICQLFIVSVDGTEAASSAIVYDIPPGGYILFNRNFTGSAEQIIKLTGDVQTFYADLRSAAGEPSLYCSYGGCHVAPSVFRPFLQ